MSGGRVRFRGEDALSDYLRQQCAAVIRGEFALRDGAEKDVVHQTRVALRRLRSVIRSFAPLLSPDAATLRDVEEDLRWLAGLLSDIRDADVLEARLLAQVADLPPELVMGDVAQEITRALAGVRRRTVEHWQGERVTDRFRATMRLVAHWYDRPPIAGEPISDAFLRRRGAETLDAAERRARKRLGRAGDDPELLHRARKALKRLRYTAEVLAPVLPRAERTATRSKRLQKRLGNHQDLMVEVAFLRHQAAVLGSREGHNAFSYGVLLTRAEHAAEEIRQRRIDW